MKLLVIGAAGKLGRELVGQGLGAGHSVTALVRRPPPEGAFPSGTKVARGDLLDASSLRAAVVGQDAVLAAVASKPGLRRSPPLYAPGAASLLAAMEAEGVRRLLWVTSAAVEPEDLAATAPVFRWLIEPLLLKGVYADAAASEAVLRPSALDWTFVRPTQLTDGSRVGAYRVDPRHTPPGGRTISRADLAAFMLREVTARAHVRGTPVIAY